MEMTILSLYKLQGFMGTWWDNEHEMIYKLQSPHKWGFIINCRWTHTCAHIHIHRHPFIHKNSLAPKRISIMMQPPVKSHAGSSPCPPSSLCHYPLRLSAFRKIEEGLKSFEEKQVNFEHRLLKPHLPILLGVWVHLHFLDTHAPGN